MTPADHGRAVPDHGHVLVCRLDNMGDVLLTGPAVRAVAAGAADVTLLCGPVGVAAAALLPGVSSVLAFDAPWVGFAPRPVDGPAVAQLVDQVRRRQVDEALIFTSFHQSPLPLALLLRLAGVPRISAISVDYPGALLDLRHAVDDDIHEVERSMSLARAAGFNLPPGDDGHLAVDLHGRRGGPAGVEAGGAPAGPFDVVVHPGASVPARAWAPAAHAAAVQALAGRGHRVAVTGGPGERDLTALVTGAPRAGVTDLGGATSLAALARVLAAASVVVAGNTGTAHLAAAVGTPVVSLFAPVVPAVRWRPWGVDHVLLGDQSVPCAGCRARECPVPGHPCLSGVGVGDVVAAVDRLAALEVTA